MAFTQQHPEKGSGAARALGTAALAFLRRYPPFDEMGEEPLEFLAGSAGALEHKVAAYHQRSRIGEADLPAHRAEIGHRDPVMYTEIDRAKNGNVGRHRSEIDHDADVAS